MLQPPSGCGVIRILEQRPGRRHDRMAAGRVRQPLVHGDDRVDHAFAISRCPSRARARAARTATSGACRRQLPSAASTPLREPGHACSSGAVRHQLGADRLQQPADLGMRGLALPRSSWRAGRGSRRPGSRTPRPPALPSRKSIALVIVGPRVGRAGGPVWKAGVRKSPLLLQLRPRNGLRFGQRSVQVAAAQQQLGRAERAGGDDDPAGGEAARRARLPLPIRS